MLVENSGFVVSERDRVAAVILSSQYGVLRRDTIVADFFYRPLRKMPVLTKLAPVVAASSTSAKYGCSGKHVEMRFFFDRVDLQGAWSSIDQ